MLSRRRVVGLAVPEGARPCSLGRGAPMPSVAMTTRAKIDRLLDQLSESELQAEYQRLREAVEGEPEMGSLPEGWGETLTGEPMPNVVAAVRR